MQKKVNTQTKRLKKKGKKGKQHTRSINLPIYNFFFVDSLVTS